MKYKITGEIWKHTGYLKILRNHSESFKCDNGIVVIFKNLYLLKIGTKVNYYRDEMLTNVSSLLYNYLGGRLGWGNDETKLVKYW